MDNIRERIKKHYLFKSLSNKDLNRILSFSKIKSYKTDEPIINQGAEASYFFYLLEGQIKLHFISSDGKEKIVKFVNSNETFAEALMFLNKERYPINATAISNCQLIKIPCNHFSNLLTENSELCMNMLGSVCLKIRQHITEIEMLTILDASQRVATYFYDLMPYSLGDSGSFELILSKKNIAEKLAMRAETLSRILKKLEQQQVLSYNNNRVTVFNRNKLEQFKVL